MADNNSTASNGESLFDEEEYYVILGTDGDHQWLVVLGAIFYILVALLFLGWLAFVARFLCVRRRCV